MWIWEMRLVRISIRFFLCVCEHPMDFFGLVQRWISVTFEQFSSVWFQLEILNHTSRWLKQQSVSKFIIKGSMVVQWFVQLPHTKTEGQWAVLCGVSMFSGYSRFLPRTKNIHLADGCVGTSKLSLHVNVSVNPCFSSTRVGTSSRAYPVNVKHLNIWQHSVWIFSFQKQSCGLI